VVNAKFDVAENRWKALQNYALLRARKFVENACTPFSQRFLGRSVDAVDF